MSDVEILADFEKRNARIAYENTSYPGDNRDKTRSKFYLYNAVKRSMDIFISIFALLLLFPMIAAVCVALLVTQGGPILISHRRVGRSGKTFPCLKFRTMVPNAEEILARHLAVNPEMKAEWEASRKLKNDPRITALGRSLRKTSIDEIPQLLNIIRGEMSLVGPRPITISETDFYGTNISAYTSVRPGLTGLWQVSGRSDTSYAQRVELDTRYFQIRSLWIDFVIIAKTFMVITSSRGSY